MYIWIVKKWIFYILFFLPASLIAQDSSHQLNNPDTLSTVVRDGKYHITSPTTINNKRFYLITGIHASYYGGSLLLLGQAWYKDFPKTSFHTFNDSKEWLQVDKVGHGFTAYNFSKYSKGMWEWTGLSHEKATWIGGLSSIGYLTLLETFDAYSAKWGWSWTDIGANVAGTGMYVAQELLWKEQRVQFKFSAHRKQYDPSLINRANELYGKSLPERLLKDYNGQTYWLSMNMSSFAKESGLPPWFNISVGYGAEGLLGGFENIGFDKSGNMVFNRPDIRRERQWYLSPDIDFTKIKTNKKLVRTMFSVLNMLKMPAPALELSGGKIKGRLLVF